MRAPTFVIGVRGVVEEIAEPGAPRRIVFDPPATLRELRECVRRSRVAPRPSPAGRPAAAPYPSPFWAVIAECPWLNGRLSPAYSDTAGWNGKAHLVLFADDTTSMSGKGYLSERLATLDVRLNTLSADGLVFELYAALEKTGVPGTTNYVVTRDGAVYEQPPPL